MPRPRRAAPNKVRIPSYTRAYVNRGSRGKGYRRRAIKTGSRGASRRMTAYSGRATQGRYAKRIQATDLAVARARAAMKLSPCVQLWTKSLLDPFTGPLEACNPFAPSVYSERLRLWCRSSFMPSVYASTSSPGTPIPLMLHSTPANDGVFLSAAAAGAYATNTSFNSYVTSVIGQNNSPYTESQFSRQNQFTIVSMGMRVRYTGTADAMNGFIGIYEDDVHDNLLETNSYSQDIVHAHTGYKIVPVSTDWVEVLWSGPRKTTEFQYNEVATATSIYAEHGSADTTTLYMDFNCNDDTPFLVECFLNIEVTGKLVRGGVWSEQKINDASTAQNAVQHATGGTGLGGVEAEVKRYEKQRIVRKSTNLPLVSLHNHPFR